MKFGKFFCIAMSAFVVMGASSVFAKGDPVLSIIPFPADVKLSGGSFEISAKTKIIFTDETKALADYLKERMSSETGLKLDTEKQKNGIKYFNYIILEIEKNSSLNEEAYSLSSSNAGVRIKASTEHGVFNGIQTLRQMYLNNFTKTKSQSVKISCAEIKDSPRFGWRGLNLDCGRHFMSKDFVKRYIDLLALHKMNVFHWHLTEDQGWRIEIKKYPELTKTGAWRKDKDGNKYGGFYTQEEIKEVVEYAKSRFITVVPEIEMLGHSQASLASYPQNSCTGGPFEVGTQWGVMKDIYCAGNENTFKFLEDVLTEVMQLFPGKYIHIGGDEAPKDRWKECPKCQARIKAEGLKDEHELQSYFIKRIEKFLTANNKSLVGWDEILEGGLAPNATVQSWRGVDGAVAAAKSGHNTIVSPYNHTYFNSGLVELDLKKAYAFEPVPDELSKEEGKFVIGSEANMWTEYAPQETIDSKLFPRILALSECVWSPKEEKNYGDFTARLQKYYHTLDIVGVHYGPESKPVSIAPSYDSEKNLIKIKLEAGQPGTQVYYTLDGSEPTNKAHKYTKEIVLEKSKVIKAVSIKGNNKVGEVVSQSFIFHKATGKKIELLEKYANKYNGGGSLALIDGMRGTSSYNDGYWQGYEGKDFSGIIDLGKNTKIQKISAGFLQNNGSWIFLPLHVTFSVSDDGKNFILVETVKNTVPANIPDIIQKDFSAAKELNARYIKVDAKSIGKCPSWHPGAGGDSWLFMDEIIVE